MRRTRKRERDSWGVEAENEEKRERGIIGNGR